MTEPPLILATERLQLRELTQNDYQALALILQDPIAMEFYEHAFSDAEVQEWLDRQLARYHEQGYGGWGVVLKESGAMIGQCGLTLQPWLQVPDGERLVLEVGYLFQRRYWHRGYATEAAIACRDYAFQTLKATEVFSLIRDTNLASQRVAMRNGMRVRGQFVKHYYGVDMPHLVYCIDRAEWLENQNIPAN